VFLLNRTSYTPHCVLQNPNLADEEISGQAGL